MDFQIIQTSEYARALLDSPSGAAVHSVYRSTVNLSLCGRLAALQVFGSPLSPISLIAEQRAGALQDLGFAPGQPADISGTAVQIGPHTFHYGHAPAEDLRLAVVLTPSSSLTLSERIRSSIDAPDTSGMCGLMCPHGNPLSLADEYAQRYMNECADSLRSGRHSQAAADLCRLIGLGGGLTPSGDDFLCGVLAGLTLRGKDHEPFAQHLRAHIQAHLGNTNDISAAFLRCALDGQYSQAVCRLIQIPPAPEIRASFQEIGHSSGMDTLCGVLYALENV